MLPQDPTRPSLLILVRVGNVISASPKARIITDDITHVIVDILQLLHTRAHDTISCQEQCNHYPTQAHPDCARRAEAAFAKPKMPKRQPHAKTWRIRE